MLHQFSETLMLSNFAELILILYCILTILTKTRRQKIWIKITTTISISLSSERVVLWQHFHDNNRFTWFYFKKSEGEIRRNRARKAAPRWWQVVRPRLLGRSIFGGQCTTARSTGAASNKFHRVHTSQKGANKMDDTAYSRRKKTTPIDGTWWNSVKLGT